MLRRRGLVTRGSRRAPGFATRLWVTRFTRFDDTFPVVDDFRGGAVASAFLEVGSETVDAGETAGVGVGGTFWCGGGFAVGRVGAFFLLVVGVDLANEVVPDFSDADFLNCSFDGCVLLDEETDGGETDTDVEMTEVMEEVAHVEIEVQVEGDANVRARTLDDMLPEGPCDASTECS